MSDELPSKKPEWRQAASRNNIHLTQPLADGTAFVSGSKFQFEHFLRLRVLYKTGQPPNLLAKHPGFPRENFKEMEQLLDKDTHALFLSNFLQSTSDIRSNWNADKAEESGKFGIAMEHLHLIASRDLREMEDNEDKTNNKIVLSPVKTLNAIQPRAPNRSLPNLITPTSTPTPRPRYQGSYYQSPSSGLDVSGLEITPQTKEGAQIRSELRQAEDLFESADFSPGDEQTVNAALVALIIALAWVLRHTGRIHHDRASFRIRRKDSNNDLYKAGVDGLVMHLDEDKCNGFMEVKRDFRSRNSPVRRQIAAQMAAFIYEQDIALAGTATDITTEDVTKGATKAKAKDYETQQRHGGTQKLFRKWMISLDGCWAHINLATYDSQYLDFLSGDQPSGPNDAFMEMREFGSFDLRRWSGDGLELFLQYVGALMLGTPG